MFWLSRPPYARWLAAFVVVVVGLVVEFREEPRVPHPFATQSIAVGEVIDSGRVQWTDVPAGLLPTVSLPMVAERPIAPGEPIPPGQGQASPNVPPDSWALEVPLPIGARAGMRVRLVTPTLSVDGIIVETMEGDFGERSGLVAVRAEDADAVAAAVLDAHVAVMVGG